MTLQVGIFIVRKGCSIPLHNHPNMFGIIKCLAGRFDLTSYSPLTEEEACPSLPGHLSSTHHRQLHDDGLLFSAGVRHEGR